jgi:hypothetical protein
MQDAGHTFNPIFSISEALINIFLSTVTLSLEIYSCKQQGPGEDFKFPWIL